MEVEGTGGETLASLDGELSDQDRVWLDGEQVRMAVQKGLLYFHLEHHKEFLDTGTLPPPRHRVPQ